MQSSRQGDALGQYLTCRANRRHSFLIAQSAKRPWARNGAPFGVMLGENPYPRLKLQWRVKLQWLAAARHPLQCHPKQCADKTYDPRRPGATSSLLSCRPNRSRSAPRQSYDKRAAPHVHFHSDDHNINVRRRLAARAKVTLVAAIEG